MRFSFLVWSLIIIFCANGYFLENSPAMAGTEPTLRVSEKSQDAKIAPVSGEILTRLPNGLLVYIIKDTRFPLVCTRLYVRAGSASEKASEAGISHVLEHMVFKGTALRPKGQVAKDVEELGGYLNAATSFDKTWYITDMPAEHWQMGMDVVWDMAFQATLDQKELEAEKEVVISELKRGEDSPAPKLHEQLQVAALKNTPYGRPIIGFEQSIRALTVNDLRSYLRRWYQPQNMMLLVAGDIEPEAVLAHAQNLFGKLENTTDLNVPRPLDLTDASGGPVLEVTRGPWSKVYFGLSLPAPAMRDLRAVDLDVLCYLLGGDGTSDFYKKYKYERQLVDSISVGSMNLERAGLLSITAQLDADKLEEFWQELSRDLGRLSAESFSQDAVKRAKFNLEDSLDRAGETLNGLTAWKGTIQFELGGKVGERNLRFAQRNVDKPQLQEAIDQWFVPKLARLRVLAPKDAKIPDLEAIMRSNWQTDGAKDAKNENNVNLASDKREIIDLGNNSTLILIPDKNAPYVSLDLAMRGGNALLKPDQQGLAGLTARLLGDGCGDLDAQAMERWLAERAASMSASAGMQSFSIAMTGPSRFNADYFDLLRKLLLHSRFEAKELKREVENMKAELAQRKDKPLAFIFSRLNPFLFPGEQEYAYDPLGSPESLERLNVGNVRDFWAMQNGCPFVLSIAGNFSRNEVLDFVKSLPPPREKLFEPAKPVWGKQRELALALPGRNQAHLLQIFKTVPLNHPDAPALALLQAVLSGQSGLLFKSLRDEQGLGYTVTAFNRNMPEAAYTAFYIGTDSGKLEQARKGFAAIIAQLKDKALPKSMLSAGASRMWGDYLREHQSLASRANSSASDALWGYPQDFQKMIIEKAAKLSAEELRKVVEKYFRSDNAYEVILQP